MNILNNPIKILTKLSVLLILAMSHFGCSIITENQCRYADFADLGYVDASKGKLRDHFNKYQEKCLTYNIDLSEELVLYDFGRERGLMNFCNEVKYSGQCDRGGGAGKIKSNLHIKSEMIRLRGGLPQVSSSITR